MLVNSSCQYFVVNYNWKDFNQLSCTAGTSDCDWKKVLHDLHIVSVTHPALEDTFIENNHILSLYSLAAKQMTSDNSVYIANKVVHWIKSLKPRYNCCNIKILELCVWFKMNFVLYLNCFYCFVAMRMKVNCLFYGRSLSVTWTTIYQKWDRFFWSWVRIFNK